MVSATPRSPVPAVGTSPAAAHAHSGPSGPSEANALRLFVSLLREICATRGISLVSISDDWIFHLRHGGQAAVVFGYDFSLNSATTHLLCRDKPAASALLALHDVPCVEHRLFHGPLMADFISLAGSWRPMLGYFEASGGDVVIKPADGTGGRGVSRARTEADLEAAVFALFERHRSICLSPFVPATGGEFRVGVLRGEIVFVYRKERPALIGDGRRSVRELLLERLGAAGDVSREWEALAPEARAERDDAAVPGAGQVVLLDWRHNLGLGAVPVLLNPDESDVGHICGLARRATEVLGAALAAVDVVVTPTGAKVLEVNSGIMMENLARRLPEGLSLARTLYDRIVCAVFGIKDGESVAQRTD